MKIQGGLTLLAPSKWICHMYRVHIKIFS